MMLMMGSLWRLANSIVIKVMGRSHLNDARTKIFIDVSISNDRNFASDQRQHNILTDQSGVARIFRMNGNGRITEQVSGRVVAISKV